jgi:short-subunit dehydrogenase
MNTIVGTLWRSNDTAPLIMPGSVLLRDSEVMTEITQYLEDQWKVIIDADVDGPNSVPAQVDKDNPDLLGKRAGPIDVLVNNAGLGTGGDFATASADMLRQVTQVNYLAPAELSRQVIPRMLRRDGGHIVNVSSMAGSSPLPGLAVYSASKAALSHFTAGLRADLHGLPISTTLVELGPIPTDMLAEAESYAPTAKAFQRAYRIRLIVDVPREKVAEEVVKAVRKGRRHVRLPKRGAAFPILTEMPRRATELLLTGVPHRVK